MVFTKEMKEMNWLNKSWIGLLVAFIAVTSCSVSNKSNSQLDTVINDSSSTANSTQILTGTPFLESNGILPVSTISADGTLSTITVTPTLTYHNVLITPTPTDHNGKCNNPSIPPARYLHSMAYDSKRDVIIIYGGIPLTWDEEPYEDFSDTWEYDGHCWHHIMTTQSPGPLRLHTMAYDSAQDKTILFNPLGNEIVGKQTWLFNGTDWEKIEMETPPAPHDYTSIVYDSDRETLILFGGIAKENTWIFENHIWQPIPPLDSVNTRFLSHEMVYVQHQNSVILQPNITQSIGRTFRLVGNEWEVVTSTEQGDLMPPQQAFFGLAYDEQRSVMVLLSSAIDGTTWEFDGNHWYQANPLQSPPPRWGHKLIYDEARGVIVLFGGQGLTNQVMFNDMWEYDGITWVQR